MTPTVTLTTDFGRADAYAAAMKGVILTIAPGVSCVDITHEVPPQDVLHGAYVLAEAVPFFPQGFVHAAVVDPGVGTDRRAIAVRVGGVHLVGPDNGVLSLAIEALLPASADWPLANEADEDDGALARTVESPAPAGVEVFELTDPAYRLAEVSNVFHGRDIFAPAAAHLCLGVDAARMGPRLATLRRLRIARPSPPVDGAIVARVLHVDGFGNAVTNLRHTDAPNVASVEAAGRVIGGVRRSYGSAEDGAPLAVWGSGGRLEIAVRNGSAARTLALARGDRVLARLDG